MEKTVSILLSLTLIISVFTISPFEVSAQGVVSCIERSWDGEKVVATEKTVSEYTVLDENTDTELSEGWYVVTRDVTFADRLMIGSGTVNLILCDYATLTDHAGIGVAEDAALNIYGQTENTGTILVHPQEETADPDNAAIGGTNDPAGDITVHGGTLDLKNDAGGCNGAGLGGGAYGAPSSVTIYAVPSRLNRSAARVSEAASALPPVIVPAAKLSASTADRSKPKLSAAQASATVKGMTVPPAPSPSAAVLS